jgi:hypothetical protein
MNIMKAKSKNILTLIKAKYRHGPTTLERKMDHFHVQWKRNKENKDMQIKMASKTRDIIQKLGETTPTNRQIQQKWHLQNEMLRLPTKIHRTNRQSIPHQIQRTNTSNYK